MNNQSIQRIKSINSLGQNVICFNRRVEKRRKVLGLQAYSSAFDPNPFSRRMGIDRRETILEYGKQAD